MTADLRPNQIDSAAPENGPATPEPETHSTIDWKTAGILAILVLIGLWFRLGHPGAIGFAEDEVNKVVAVRAYEGGDITANGEHPMLMKALMFVSVKSARALWGAGNFSEEAAFRFPNAIVGALTVIPLFLLMSAFFDRAMGLWTAAFWSAGVNAITINRIGKEDTLLVFFMLFAFYFYLRAKQTDSRNKRLRSKNYLLSGASFGLMVASKYFPHYIGLNSLYHHYVRVRQRKPGEPSGKTSLVFYIALVAAFLIANPPVLLPHVWSYLNEYMGEKLLVHSGYLFGGHLYKNNMSSTPFWGTPMYFYLLFMAIKIPLLVLVSFIAGIVNSVKRWRHPGHAFILFMFVFWIVPYSLVGPKWLRYTLSLMPFIYMFAAVGAVELVRKARSFSASNTVRVVVLVVAAGVFIGLPAWSAYSAAPHYALYTNALGANHVGFFFPHDEFYDDGLREAIKMVCDRAPIGATIAHETPAVARYYLEKFGRSDLQSRAISSPEFNPQTVSAPAYIIVQRGRTYFENQTKLEWVRANFKKVDEVTIRGIAAAEVFEK